MLWKTRIDIGLTYPRIAQ